jgi:hypothetical protein
MLRILNICDSLTIDRPGRRTLQIQNIQNADTDLFGRRRMKLGAKQLILGKKACVLSVSLFFKVIFGDKPQCGGIDAVS